EVIQLLVTNTNLYIDKIKARFGRDRDALPSDDTEMNAFLGLLIMAGVLRASHLNFIDLWAQDGSGVEMFRLTMSYKRFLFLLRCLRFDNTSDREERLKIDNMAAIRSKELLTPEYKLTLLAAALVTDHQKRRIQLRAVPTTTKKRLREVHDVDETVQQSTAKRGRCSSCSRKNDKKLTSKCFKCHKFICQQHSRVYCVGCRTEESADETD
ncbi:hypothetical protein HW555_008115, partial [Spodoptera exigua]